MNQSQLTLFLTRGVLNRKLQDSPLSEDTEAEDSSVKNVCARIPLNLADSLESACTELSCSKRQFIEAAINNALSEYRSLAYEYDMTGERQQEANEEAYEEYLQEQLEKGKINPETGEPL